jgi:hypothetical protein
MYFYDLIAPLIDFHLVSNIHEQDVLLGVKFSNIYEFQLKIEVYVETDRESDTRTILLVDGRD